MSDSTPLARFAQVGCARHVGVIGGLLAMALLIVLARNWGGVSRFAIDAEAAREGQEVAATLDSPEALLAWVRAHPEAASLVVWDDSVQTLAVAPEVARPVPGLPVLLLGAEVARQAAAGLDTTAAVPAGTVAERRLPSIDAPGPEPATVGALTQAALAGDRASADALLALLGRDAVEATPDRLGVPELEAPLPVGGLLLAWDDAGLDADPEATPRPAWRDSAFAREARFLRDGPERRAELGRIRRRGLGLTIDVQRAAAAASLPRGTASGYADLLRRVQAGEVAGAEALRQDLEAVTPPMAGGDAEAVALRRGGIQGHLAAAGYLVEGSGRTRVAVLVLADLPHAVYRRLIETGLDAGLVLGLLLGEVDP